MVESTATIKLRAVDTNVVSTINNVSTASTNALIGATALAGGFKLLEKASNTSVAAMAVGADNSLVLANNFGKLATAGNKATAVLGKLSTASFYVQQFAIAADGVGRAAEQYARLPQAMQAMQASGVSTYTIQQFNTLTEAIRGSDVALDSLLVSSIAELGEFEKAAARAGTILKSSLRFDDSGNPLTANATERLDNALSIQKLVNDRLNNSVTSTEALTGQYEVLSSGFVDAVQSQEVLEQGLKLITIGKAGGKSVNPTATLQLLTKTLNAYELSAADAAKTAAVLNSVVENGLTTIPELSLGFGRMAAQASKASIGLNDSGAAVAVLTAQGTSTAEAMTGIGRIAANIIDKTPEAEKELAKLQLRGEKIRFNKAEIQAKGFTQALIDLYDAAGGSSAVLTKIFPEDVAFRTASALLTEQGRRLSATKEAISRADETKLNEIVDVAQSDRVARFQRLANRFKETIIEIGISLAPTLEPGIKALETIANKFASLPEPVRKAIGSYLAFQIQSKAIGNAAGTLIKTLVGLATNYLLVRTVSLALTGQLGKEAKAVKALVVQKKGLAAATLQLFGIDQKWRLEQTAATAAIAKQGKVAQAAAAAKAKAASTVKTAAVGGIAATSGITKEKTVAELNKRKAQAIALAQYSNVKAREYAQQIANRYGFQLPSFAAPTEVKTPIALLPPAGGTSGIYAPPTRTPVATPTPPVPIVKSRLPGLVASDRAVADASAQYGKAKGDYDELVKQRRTAQKAVTKAQNNAQRAQVTLLEAKNKALTVSADKQQAMSAIALKQQKLTAANNALALKEHEFRKLNTAAMVAQNRVATASIGLETARGAAKAKYLPLSKATTIATLREQRAIALATAARIAALKAQQAEIALGNKSKITMLLKRDARLSEIAATKAQAVAAKKRAVATALETKLTLAQTLAEQGLYQTKIFGRTVRLSEVGLIGKLNKILTTNILLVNAAGAAEAGLTKTKAGLLGVTKLLNYQIGLQTIKLGAIKGIRTLESAFLLLQGGVKKASGAIASIAAPLGALAPLLGVAAVAAIVLRDEFFGLGKDVRAATKDYQKFLKEQDKLNSSIEKRRGLTAIEGLLDGGNYQYRPAVEVDADVEIERGVVNSAMKAVEEEVKEAVAKPVKVGQLIFDSAGNLIFGSADDRDRARSNSPIVQQLNSLKDSGALTTTEFNKLSAAFDATAGGGDRATKSLAKLRAEIKRIKSDGQDIEKGVVSSFIDAVKKAPSMVLKAVEAPFVASAALGNTLIKNTYGRASNALFGTNIDTGFVSYGDIQQARETDKLIESQSTLNNIQVLSQKRYLETTIAIGEYRENLALTQEAQQKVAQGYKLTSGDLANEQATYKARADRNRNVIEQLETQIAANKKIAQKTKNEENKQLVEGQIEQAQRQKEALEEQNEALKQLAEDTKNYLTNTLPALKTGLKEASDPNLALSNARDKFNQPYLTDAEGKVTKVFKDLEQLRNDGANLASQVQENLSLGVLDSFDVGGEAIAAEQIKAIRDDRITILEDGVEVNRYRYTLAQRREFTAGIVALENEDLKRAEAKNQLEIDLVKALGQAQLETAAVTNLKLAQAAQAATRVRIQQKEKEIAEFKKLGLRTIDQEMELDRLRLQQQSAGYGVDNAKLEERLNKLNVAAQKSQLTAQRSVVDSGRTIDNLQIENSILEANIALTGEQNEVRSKIVQLTNQISTNAVFNAGVEKQSLVATAKAQAAILPLQRSQLKNQIEIVGEQKQQQLTQAQIKEEEAEVAKIAAKERYNLARRNGASALQLEQLKLQIEQADLNLDRARDDVDMASDRVDLQQQLNQRKLSEFEVNQQIDQGSRAIAVSRAQLKETEVKITREYSLQNQAIQLRANQSQVESSAFNSILNFRVGELNLAQQVASNERDKLKIARQMATLKLQSLKTQLASEAEVLALNQQQAKLQLQAKQSQTTAQLEQNQADITKARADFLEVQASGASPEAIEAAEAQVNAAIAQRQALLITSKTQADEARLLEKSQAAARQGFKRESILKVDSARVEAIAALPEKQRKSMSKRLFKELQGKADVGTVNPNLGSVINGLKNFKIEVPDLKIPKIELPSLEDIKKDVRAIVQEFNLNKPPRSSSADYLNTYEGEGKKFVIQNLSFDTPINININGEDKAEIAEQVEVAVNNTMTDFFTDFEQKLN